MPPQICSQSLPSPPFPHLLPPPCQVSLMVCASVLAFQSLYPACWLQMPNVFIYHEADLGWMLLEKCPLFKMSLPLNRPCIILTGILSEAPEWRGWMEGCHSSWHGRLGWAGEWGSEWVPELSPPSLRTTDTVWTMTMTGDATGRLAALPWSVAGREQPAFSQPASQGAHFEGLLSICRPSGGWQAGKRVLPSSS